MFLNAPKMFSFSFAVALAVTHDNKFAFFIQMIFYLFFGVNGPSGVVRPSGSGLRVLILEMQGDGGGA